MNEGATFNFCLPGKVSPLANSGNAEDVNRSNHSNAVSSTNFKATEVNS